MERKRNLKGAEEEEEDHLTWKDCSREYSRTTSTHGLRRIGWSVHCVAKLIWGILFTLAVIAYLAIMILLLKDYLEYPTRMQVKTELAHQNFPGVTFCSLNPVRASLVGSSYTDEFNKFNRDAMYNGSNYGAMDPYLADRVLFAKEVGRMNAMKHRIEFGFKREHLVLHCAFEGRECDLQQDFVHLWNDVYGDCYTFGGGNQSVVYAQTRKSRTPGPLHGLQLILNVQPEEQLKSMTEVYGMRILVHSPSEMPFPEEGGLSLPPGAEASVSVRPEIRKRLGHPYSECEKEHVNAYNYLYSATACQKGCVQEMILESCLCGDPMLPLSTNQAICSLNDMYSKEYVCAERIKAELKSGKRKCVCPPPCKETKYEKDYSLAGWPNPRHEALLDKSLEPVAGVPKYNKKDLVAVKVFYRDVGVTVFEEEATFELHDYFSYLGGLSALFVGVSILTLVEFVEYLLTMLTIPCVDYPEWEVDAMEKRRRRQMYQQRPATTASARLSECHTAATIREVEPRLNTPDATVNARPMPPRMSNNIKIVSS